MDVFVEYAVTDNFVMDYFLLKLTTLGIPEKSSVKKRILSSLLGTVFAVYLPLIKISPVPSIILKALVSVAMVYFCADFDSPSQYAKRFALFWMFTALFGGIIYGISGIVGAKYDPVNNLFVGKIPLFVALSIGLVLYAIACRVFAALSKRRVVAPFIRKCVLFYGNEKIEATALIDSGNGIVNKEYESVCVAGRGLSDKLRHTFSTTEKPEKVYFGTASGGSVMQVYSLDKIVVINGKKQNTIYKAKIGLPDNPVDFAGDYSLVLPAEYAFIG